MNKDKAVLISKIAQALKEKYNPKRLFLFGSQATGKANKDSDYDFVMVVPDAKKSSVEEMSHARSLLFQKFKISADVFIYSEKEFEDWKDEFSSIPETALNTGKEIEL